MSVVGGGQLQYEKENVDGKTNAREAEREHSIPVAEAGPARCWTQAANAFRCRVHQSLRLAACKTVLVTVLVAAYMAVHVAAYVAPRVAATSLACAQSSAPKGTKRAI